MYDWHENKISRQSQKNNLGQLVTSSSEIAVAIFITTIIIIIVATGDFQK